MKSRATTASKRMNSLSKKKRLGAVTALVVDPIRVPMMLADGSITSINSKQNGGVLQEDGTLTFDRTSTAQF